VTGGNGAETTAGDTYRNKLKKAFAGTINMGLLLPVGAAPRGYVTLKLHEGDIKLPVHVVKKVTKKHQVTMDTIERLPELLAKPVFVFKSLTDDKALVVIVDAKDAVGNPILVAMSPTNNGFNTISSVYGKDNVGNFIQKNIDAHSALYVDEKKALNTVRPLELQLLQVDSAKNLIGIVYHQTEKKSSGFDEILPLF
jgi:hypothetical protein